MKAIHRFHLFLTLFAPAFLLLALAGGAASISAQTGEEYKAMRAEAMALFEQHRLADAVPILEKLHAADPKDLVILDRLAWATFVNSATIKDAEARKQSRVRARNFALKAKEMGDESNLLKILLDIPADGSESGFSNRKDVEAAMREGEAAFARGDFEKAIAAYQLALQLDPQQYEATLFIGDVYFKQKKMELAGEWFAKAIALQPDRETAHRYWGDALAADGKRDAARDKFIDAIVAEPYKRTSWMGLSQWGQRNGVQLAHPRVDIPTSVSQSAGKDGKNETNITLDGSLLGKKDGTSGWMFYGITRALWMNKKFLKEYPNEKEYRHSLREEVDALHGVVEAAKNELKDSKGKTKLDPSIANLVKLNDAGLLEAFILLAKPDAGIARDYESYRTANRAKLRQYLLEYVVANK